jgi:hypothetical protein
MFISKLPVPAIVDRRWRGLISAVGSSEKTHDTDALTSRFHARPNRGDPMRRRLAVSIVVIAMLHIVGCRSGSDEEPRETRRGAEVSSAPTPPPVAVLETPRSREGPSHRAMRMPDPQVLAAMLSVHAHAFWPDRHFPGDYRPLPLDQAIEILNSDHTPLASLRRRRAAARLGAYGPERQDFRKAVRTLGFDPTVLDAVVSPIRPIQNPTPDGEDAARVQREEQLFDALGDPLDTRGCNAKDFYQQKPDFVWVANAGASVVLNVGVTVPRPTKDVARAIDPQKWDECDPLFWPPEHTYLVDFDEQTKSYKNAAHKPAGEPYGKAPNPTWIFEHFECNTAGCPGKAWFENILGVSLEYDPGGNTRVSPNCDGFVDGRERYIARYYLEDHRAGSASKLTTDEGDVWAEAITPGSTRVCMHKKLEFSADEDTGAIEGAWKVLSAEMGGLLAELACCPVGKEDDVPVSALTPTE